MVEEVENLVARPVGGRAMMTAGAGATPELASGYG